MKTIYMTAADFAERCGLTERKARFTLDDAASVGECRRIDQSVTGGRDRNGKLHSTERRVLYAFDALAAYQNALQRARDTSRVG